MRGLRDLRVIDFTSGIAGPYCTKLFADAGADVIKVESGGGDPMRGWSATGAELGERDGALFRFLNGSKRSVLGTPGDPEVLALIDGADLVVEDFSPVEVEALGHCKRLPSLVWLSITPFGRHGPWSGRPATEFTIQAESGSIGTRGLRGGEPFQAGGRITEWVGGTFASVAALAAVRRARETGHGEHVDFSLLEVMTIAASNYLDLSFRLLGVEALSGSIQSVETPSIEPTADGFVGFCTNTAQQFSDFLLMIGRPDLREDKALFQVAGRMARFEEWNEIVHAYTSVHSTAEIVEAASLLRIPVAPVNNGETVRQHEQLLARKIFAEDPSGGFVRPLPPYRIDGERPPFPRPAARLGEHSGRIEPRNRPQPEGSRPRALPLEGLRILDFTAWWAGPSATHMLASLGADVIHVESVQRIDGMRSTGGMMSGRADDWWEWSTFFLSANTNKRGLTLNLADPRGVELAKQLIACSDAAVENFTPRVLDGFGLTWDVLHHLNPELIVVRMPAFGLDGPWRDHTGFAQTMEQLTGMAWLTGHRDDQPRIQRGPCDPLAGMHAAFALLVALFERKQRGTGCFVEVAMVEGALNAAAEQAIEFSAYGNLMQRQGNRCPEAAPQGLYACRQTDPGAPAWLALSVATNSQWRALIEVLGAPLWARDSALKTLAGRHEAHDAIDARLRTWAAKQDREAIVEVLLAAGVPAAPVADPRATSRNPQMQARGFYEEVTHPSVGTHPIPTLPFRYASVERWTRFPAPTLGQHSREILSEALGLDDATLDGLEADAIIGTRPAGI